MFAYRKQPWKALYLLYAAVTFPVVRLPVWLVRAAVPALRPRRAWTMKRTLGRDAIAYILGVWYQVGMPREPSDPARDSKNAAATGFVWVDPVPQELVVGDIAEYARRNEVEPVKSFGYWFGPKAEDGSHGQPAGKDERVVYYLHGTSSF